MNTIVNKPWGTYQVLAQGKNYLTKKIYVKPNGKLSLQSQQYRSEYWIIAMGKAVVTINDEIKIFKENEALFIPKGSLTKYKLFL